MSRARCLLLLVLVCLTGCPGSSSKTPPLTSPEKPKVESELATTTLSKEAAVSLQIQTQPVTLKEVHEHLSLTGWIMARPGNEVTLTAPAAGYVQFPDKKNMPIAGNPVKADEHLLELKPVLSPVEEIQVAALKRSIESELVKAESTLKTTESEYDRLSDLHKQNLRSKQEYEQALKARDHAREERKAARDKLDKVNFFQTLHIPVKASQPGIILQLHVSHGQYVPLAAPLISIIDLNPLWIRVPIAEFDLQFVDPKQSISIPWKSVIQNPGDKPVFITATPTGRVAQVDPLRRTADIWYELAAMKETERFVKDQMLTVHVPIGKKQKASVVPYSAIIFDAHGNTWIYVDSTRGTAAEHKYERRKVELVTAIDDSVLISVIRNGQRRPALTDGEHLVTSGAAALFSREFHKTPVHVPAEGK